VFTVIFSNQSVTHTQLLHHLYCQHVAAKKESVEEYKTKDFFLHQWYENGDLQVMVTQAAAKMMRTFIRRRWHMAEAPTMW
jgi:hypothetical protein